MDSQIGILSLRKQPIILVPLNLEEVREDQLKLQRSSEQKKEKEINAENEKKRFKKKKKKH